MPQTTVFGESLDDVGQALLAMRWRPRADGSGTLSGNIQPQGPLLRAMFRAEAELLLEDAAEMANEEWEHRTQSRRGADALVRVAERLAASASASATDYW